MQGLTAAHAIASGVIQGGGLDPFWYVLYTVLLATAVEKCCAPVTVDTLSGPVAVTILCVVDDTVVLAPTITAVQNNAAQCVTEIQRLNGKCNPDKFDLIHQQPSHRGAQRADGAVRIDGQVIKSAARGEYVKMVGGNIHLAATVNNDEQELRKHSRRVMSRLAQHPVALRMLRGILDGMLTMRWTYRKQVDWPSDIICEHAVKGPASAAASTVARCCRMALQLPRRAPREFIYGHPRQGRLGIPNPAEKAWRVAVVELWKVAHSPHDTAREACLRELQRAFNRADHEQVAPGKTSDFAVFAQWCHSRNWHFRLYSGAGSSWKIGATAFQSTHPILLLVADCSTDSNQCTWGLGAVLATCEGKILHRLRARIRAQYTNTSVMEATAVAQGLRAVAPALPPGFMVWPWCDNQTAAALTNKRDLQGQLWHPRTMISADLELLYINCPFRTGWGPAEHDTKHRSILSALNKEAYAEAKQAWTGEGTENWRVPSTWCQSEQPTPVMEGPHGLIVDMRRAVRTEFQWPLYNRRHADDVVLPYQFWESWRVPRELSDLWSTYSGLHPHVAGNVMLMAQYNEWSRVVHDDSASGTCTACGLPYVHPLCHALRDCPGAQMSLLAATRMIAGLCRKHARQSVHISRTWAGMQLLTAKGEILVVSGHPKHMSTLQAAMPAGMPLWPVMMGMTPNDAAYSILQSSMDIPAAAFWSKATSMVYPLVNDNNTMSLQCLDDIQPEIDSRVQLHWDPRIHPTTTHASQHIPCAMVYAVCALVPSQSRVPVCVRASDGARLAVAAWHEAPEALIRIGSASQGWPGFGLDVSEGGMHIGLWDASVAEPPTKGTHAKVWHLGQWVGIAVHKGLHSDHAIAPEWERLLCHWFRDPCVSPPGRGPQRIERGRDHDQGGDREREREREWDRGSGYGYRGKGRGAAAWRRRKGGK